MRLITDHEAIRDWVEARGGAPATHVTNRKGDGAGQLDIHFEGVNDEDLEDISWDDFFEAFERNHLALLDISDGPEDEPTLEFRFTSRTNPKEGVAEASGHHA